MAAKSESEIIVHFAGLEESAKPPATALYSIGADGLPDKKLGSVTNGVLKLEGAPRKGAHVALGPDVKSPATIDPESLLRYRFDEVIDIWRERGLLIPEDRWTLLLSELVCVSGRVRKCRPWWLEEIYQPVSTLFQRSSVSRKASVSRSSLANQLTQIQGFADLIYPRWCVPMCDGKVEVWARKCCCHHPYIDVGILVDHLEHLLEDLPIEIDWPIPPPDPDPWGPFENINIAALNPQPLPPGPRPDIDMVALNPQPLPPAELFTNVRRKARNVSAAKTFDPGKTYVSERLYQDYRALRAMPRAHAQAFIQARPYLYAYYCHCTMKKVGEVVIQPNGEFDFCYWRPREFYHIHPHHHHHCHTSYAYRVKQLINGVWTVVYDGVAGQDYYGQGERAEITTTSPKARPCGEGPPPPHEGDGTPFVILQNVTGGSTLHFNFPTQTDVSKVAALAPNSGLYDWSATEAKKKDCPWATTLGLRLWSSPLLKDIVVYYRLKVAKVNASGQPVGDFQTLTAPVSWQRYDGTQKATESLAALPSDVGGQVGLYKFPYEGDGKNWFWVDYHQSWNTALFDPDGSDPAENIQDGKFMLVLEVFGPNGVRIRPNSSADTKADGTPVDGAKRPFQFRRWTNAVDTANVPFADCAHIFWVNNRSVVANIEYLRNTGTENTGECQFMSGTTGSTFSVGFRAYHADGVTTASSPGGDTNSFMRDFAITWQRGLNGPSDTLDSGTTDRGETAIAHSAALSFGYLLGAFTVDGEVMGPHTRCSFSVHLRANGKHHNGGGFLDGYFSASETASFALQMGGS